MIKVAAAIIEDEQGRLLIARRREGKSQAGLWEFPGGKLEGEESVQECLRRELMEEMNIDIEPYALFGANDHWYGEIHIHLIAYKATYVSGEIVLSDHDDYRWITPDSFADFEFAPADIKFVKMLEQERIP
ncbi:(deoxy)nucleoside triphosphate pyrophosphohydrolase [Paenibacillus mendelii]|uniref:8-oxo-dGTP diphosphatase n=1 Tax=Paenibacillus mendelii TaxID=206163 RepID=A0ABV6JKJ0_9BACL|nr:(deoxy)nucleoside triphosphate pyrophosphohydrolase [Paenibacillus mendelii]MCQ6563062.1 (deoxy)nucleoside triphosphate pyrophosphohydrolase [Paenibacillus mendelii]